MSCRGRVSLHGRPSSCSPEARGHTIPLARPRTRRPTYIAPIFVLVIMIILATQQMTLADQMLAFRPMNDAIGPAPQELIKAPSVINDEMSCCRTVDIFQPRGVGALYPKTCRKPTMA